MTRTLYKLAILVCVIDMGIIANAIHQHDTGFARFSMCACVGIAMAATHRLRRTGVRA